MEKIVAIRNFTWTDLESYADLISAAGKADGSGKLLSLREAEEFLRQPNLRPEVDCFVTEIGGELAGYALVVPELAIGRTIIEGVVHPSHRGKGVGRELLRHALRHSKGLGANLSHVSTSPQDIATQRLLGRAGLSETKRQWQLRLDPKVLARGKSSAGYEVRPMIAGQEVLLADLQNRAFTGSWGFAPNVPEELVYRTRMSGGRPEETLFLFVGEEPLAYCWTRITEAGNEPIGIVWMIGTAPEARGRGFGRTMLVESIDSLLRRGASSVELTVYQDNVPAVELYRAVGFRERGEIIWYECLL